MLALLSVMDILMMVLISGAVWTMTFLAIYGLFNQPVEVRTSFEREAAILAGHTDRQTVFEIEWLQPIMWVLLSLASGLSLPRMKKSLRKNLVASGNSNYYSVNEYLALAMLCGTVLMLLVTILGLIAGQDFNLLLAIGTWGFGFLLPVFRVSSKAKARVRVIAKKIPYSLDLIALSMGAGATFTEAVRTLVREDPQDEFNRELSQVLAEVELGMTRNEALANMVERIPLESLRTIVGAIIQAESLGTPLTDVLKAQSNLLRHQRSVRAEKAAATASVRILIPSVLILIAVVIIVFAPVILRWAQGALF
jgi:tight adherence protein C